eukprot:CAMPEP_0182424724 /NCGR_PEP_ID=MMETSP1167-20130531/10974_1 /TAXON_ID=2988 /ORGANISM="Mallomonas Sp, Strain CCMP3275" /LENGTH=296 /DNA_ID=CAMNT_0024604749 /DNA_START=634 /DNA_END=1521 /DNA_ORIENTATION=+
MNLEKSLLNHTWREFVHHQPISTPAGTIITTKQPIIPSISSNLRKSYNISQSNVLKTSNEHSESSSEAVLPREGVWREHRPSWRSLQCPKNKRGSGDLVTYARRPIKRDTEYVSPFLHTGPVHKYVTFEPDVGGWNNIRMQMETVLVFAAATGRVLVLPPDQPLYLLNKGKGHQNHHSFADFFPFEEIATRVQVISMPEFLRREGVTGHMYINGTVAYPPKNKTEFDCTIREQKRALWKYLREAAANPTWECMKEFVVIPPGPGIDVSQLPDAGEYTARKEIFAATRKDYYYDNYW